MIFAKLSPFMHQSIVPSALAMITIKCVTDKFCVRKAWQPVLYENVYGIYLRYSTEILTQHFDA